MLKPLAAALPHLTIRQKVLTGVIVPVLLFAVIGVVSYNSLLRLEGALTLMEMADDLSNTILEIRRYEKNFLLYGHVEDFGEAQRYIHQARTTLASMAADARDGHARRGIVALSAALDAYHDKGAALGADMAATASAATLDELRQAGKDMVDLSLDIKNSERNRTLALVANLKRQLLVAGLCVILSGIVLALLLARKILRALGVIVEATAEIGQGQFKTLPVPRVDDETRRVIEAFNRMTQELKRRQDQLVQEKKLSSLGGLTSGIAHQLNNPLNHISPSCQILVEEHGQCDPVFAAKMLGNISQEVLRARDIVKGLLEFSRAKDFSLKPTPLAPVVAGAFRQIGRAHV